MSEIFELFGSDSKLSRVGTGSEGPVVVLPFPTGEIDAAPATQPSASEPNGASALPLIKKLCDTLNAQQVSYCHWKSNWKLDHWLMGDGDLDLLVHRADARRFEGILCGLGFRQAEPSTHRHMPGILNFYGFDKDACRFVHLHVHYQLVIGHDLTKNYHLPIETFYLENSTRRGLLPVPARELELILFVLRMVLKYSALEALSRHIAGRLRPSSNAVEEELNYLEAEIDHARVANLQLRLTPMIDNAFFERCRQSLRDGTSFWARTRIRLKLQRRLRTCARRPQFEDALLKAARLLTHLARERLLHRGTRKGFVNGGLLIAVVGGDGAGKTTTLNAVDLWLSKRFATKRFHIGKPPRAFVTLSTIVLLRVRRLLSKVHAQPEITPDAEEPGVFPGYVQLFRWVMAGRDRVRLYVRARRFASNGGIALCDRYPLPQLRLMDGANIAHTVEPKHRNALVRRLLKAEANCYHRMMPADLLIVLRVDPETAVKRKTNESEHHVRLRSRELWEKDWEGANACVIDAGQPAADVIAQVQSLIWARL
jgi:thymidylate kinase